MSYTTTIRLSNETRDRLASIGAKHETYEKIILKLINGSIPAHTAKGDSSL